MAVCSRVGDTVRATRDMARERGKARTKNEGASASGVGGLAARYCTGRGAAARPHRTRIFFDASNFSFDIAFGASDSWLL